MLPVNTSNIMTYLGYKVDIDYTLGQLDAGVVLAWLSVSQEPTEQEIIDAGNSQAFLDWYAEHGGNPVLTLRRQAKEALSAQHANDLRFRAVMVEFVKEFNRHADKINSILDAIDNATSLGDLKTRVGAINDYPERSSAQLRTLVEAALDNGEADT